MAEGQTALTFSSTQIPSDSGILQVRTADFNGDGNQDLVFLQVSRITVVLGNGDGTFQPPIHMPVTGNFQWSSMAVGDFNNDGKVDVVVLGLAGSIQGTPFVQTYLGQGDGTLAAAISSPSSSLMGRFPIVGDVNYDGNLDLIGPGVVALGAGDGTFQQTITASACLTSAAFGLPNNAVSDFTVADFRRSGHLDWSFIATHVLGGAIFDPWYAMGIVCFGNGDATFAAGPIIYSEGGVAVDRFSVPSIQLTTGDFNGDGKADVLVATVSFPQGPYLGEPTSLTYSTILGNGDGTFQKPLTSAPIQSLTTQASSVVKPVVADMNGDGKSDLVQIANSLGVVVLLSNSDGTYDQAAAISPVQNTVSVAVADFNSDGLPDIVSTSPDITWVSINTTLRVDTVVNAASLAMNQPMAPGSLVTIFGAGLGPATGVASSSGSLPDSIAGVSVTFNGIPAPLSFVSARQINAQVPWEISGGAKVVVTVNGASTAAFQVTTALIAPGVFATASGQAFAFNSDGSLAGPNGSILGIPSHPATAADTLTVLANGLGPVTPSIADGARSSDAVRTAGSTPVFIGGVACNVSFGGLSSTQVGVNQLSVVVPAGVHGILPLQINAGGIVTAASVTIAVQ